MTGMKVGSLVGAKILTDLIIENFSCTSSSTSSSSLYYDFVQKALAGGTTIALTLDDARRIADAATGPLVIKLLSQFANEKRTRFLTFSRGAEKKGIWVICGAAPFLETELI